MTASELGDRFGLSRWAIYRYARVGVLPRPKGKGPLAQWDPVCVQLLEQLTFIRENLHATSAELAERRQLTGQLLPPEGRKPPVIARGAV